MIVFMFVVIDERLNLVFQLTREIVVLKAAISIPSVILSLS